MTDRSIDELLQLLPDPPQPDPAFEARVRDAVARELRAGASEPTTTSPETGEPTTPEVIELDTTTTLSNRRTQPSRQLWLRVAAVVLIAGTVVAGLALTRSDDAPDTVAGSTPVFEDGFDDDSGGWTTGSSPGVEVATGGGQQVWTLTASGIREILRPQVMDEDLRDMEVTADVVSIDPGATLGVLCRKGQIAAEDGAYAFRLGGGGASIVAPGTAAPLASDPSVAIPSGPFSLTGRCVDDGGVTHLEMLIDGELVLRAESDAPLRPGVAGIEAIADADADDPQIVLDRLVVDRAG